MSTGLPGPIRPKRFLGSSLYVALLVYLCVIIGAGLLYYATGQYAANSKPKNQGNVVSAQTSVSTPVSEKSQVSSPTINQPSSQLANHAPDATVATPVQATMPTPEAIATAKLRWVRIKGQVEEMRDSLSPAVSDAQEWTNLVKQLSEDDIGKRIAASKSHVDQYRTLLEQKRKPARLAKEYRDALGVHLETVQKYLSEADNVTPPSDSLTQTLNQLQDDIKAFSDEYHRARLALENLVAETAALTPATVTLAKAVEDREKEVAGEYLAQLTATKEKAEAEAQKKVRDAKEKAIADTAQAEADRLTRLGADEASRIRLETDRHIREAKAEEERKTREAESKRLRALAEDREIQGKYPAFLQKGYMRFNSSPRGGMPDQGDRPRPASFGELNSHGWLKDSQTFARAMSKQLNTDYNVLNDRPAHAYPRTAAEWEEMDKLYEQFKVLAPIWVEMKLLEP